MILQRQKLNEIKNEKQTDQKSNARVNTLVGWKERKSECKMNAAFQFRNRLTVYGADYLSGIF